VIGMIVRRLLSLIPMMLVVSFLVFGMVELIPGDAAQHLAGGVDATQEDIEEMRQALNLDDPFLVRYGRWLGNLAQGDLGDSLTTNKPITDELAGRMPITIGLAIATFVLAIPAAVVIGVIGGLRPGSRLDRFLLFGTSLGLSFPSFFLGIFFVAMFAVQVGWLPPFGYADFTESPIEWAKHMVLPASSLGVASAAALSRQVRAGLADTMQSAFVRTAWAKGGNTNQVVVGHALKNSAIPAVTIMGLQVGAILGGSVIIEQIFVLPGIGQYLLNAVNLQNVTVIQGAALVFVFIHLLSSLVVDIAYGYLNPRVRAT
jgi:peptide/nickel transport system permease protein